MASKVDEHPDVKKWRDRFAWLLIFDIVVVVAALITGLVVFDKYFKNALIPKNFAQVDDQGLIFRSGQLNEHLVRKTLEDNRIKLVLSMSRDNSDDAGEDNLRAQVEACEAMGIPDEFRPLSGDGTGDPQMYVQALALLKQAHDEGRPTLVHCGAGTHRTGGMIALWRLFVEGWSPQRTRDEMTYYGLDAHDAVVVAYLNEHMATIAHGLKDAGVIDRVPDPLPVLPN